jgi:hypothetical protein
MLYAYGPGTYETDNGKGAQKKKKKQPNMYIILYIQV